MDDKSELESDVREAIREWAEENPDNDDINYSGFLSETVDGLVPIYNAELLELAAKYPEFRYVEDMGMVDPERGVIHVIQVSIYEWLEGHAWDEWSKVQEEREESNE